MKPEGENFIMKVKMMVMKYQVRKNGRGSGKLCQNNVLPVILPYDWYLRDKLCPTFSSF